MDVITRADKEALERRLAELLANRKALSDRIGEARQHGDLRENGEYLAAREQQGLEEAEIRRIQERLATAQVVDQIPAAARDLVFLGSTVRLRDNQTGEEELYRLVGEASADPFAEVVDVTVNSPMGQALLKARVGETIRVDAPRGVKYFTVVELL